MRVDCFTEHSLRCLAGGDKGCSAGPVDLEQRVASRAGKGDYKTPTLSHGQCLALGLYDLDVAKKQTVKVTLHRVEIYD